MRNIFAGFTLLIGLFLLVGCASGQPYKDTRTGIVFPAQVAGFKRGGINHYKDPRLGYSVSYNYKGDNLIVVTLYIYNLGRSSISNDPGSPEIIKQMQQAKSNITYLIKKGRYLDGRLVSEGLMDFKGSKTNLKLRRSSILLKKTYGIFESHILLGGLHNHFFKIRCTHPAGGEAAKASREKFKEFLAALARKII